MAFRRARETLGTLADLVQVGTFLTVSGLAIVAGIVGLVLWLGGVTTPAWTLAVLTGVMVILLPAAYAVGRRRGRGAAGEGEGLAREELKVATGYLSQVDDFLSTFREATRKSSPDRLESLTRLRDLVSVAVIQGINSARGEHIRCVYFELVTENGDERLKPKHHHGHSADVENVRLFPDHRSIAGIAFAEGKSVYVKDASTDARLQRLPGGREIGSLCCVPVFGIREPTRPIGVFSVASNRPDSFALADQEFVSVCATIIGLIELFEAVFRALDTTRNSLEGLRRRLLRGVSETSDE
jgi:putative methionine-R-sulfoxide reductase with GAF domain